MPSTWKAVALSRGGATTMVVDSPDEPPEQGSPVLVLGHGGAHDMRSGFMEFFATALVERGLTVVRFNFPYKERAGTRPPDPMDVLVECFDDVLVAQSRWTGCPPGPVFVGGKSLGARVATALVAAGRVKPTGLVFLGFALHREDDRNELRTAELERIRRPMLFVQGSRDALCDLEILGRVRKEMKLPGALHVVDGGDHSFQLPESQEGRQRAALDRATAAVTEFVRRLTVPAPDGSAPGGRTA